jgi:hypothetical protein
MLYLRLILSVLCLISSTFAAAKMIELKKNTQSIFIQDKASWTLGKDLFGMPFIYFAPQLNGQRSNISFTHTGAELELDLKSITKSQDVYRDNKKKWGEQVGAKIDGFLELESFKNTHGHKIYKIGVDYTHENESYSERSYYIECRGKILFSKSLRLKQNIEHEKDFSDLIQGLDCGGV